MKNLLLLVLILFPFRMLYGQQEIVLDSCYAQARQNYPGLKQAGLWNEITALKKENIQTSKLPQVTLNGQATYQSDVTGLDISIPGLSVPQASKDQYKAYTEIRQSIWDGGISATNSKLEDAILRNNRNQLEVEIYKLNEMISLAFFTVLTAEKQLQVLGAQKTVLEEKLKASESGVSYGMVDKTSPLIIQAEILNMRQNEVQMESVKTAAIQMLSVLTGKTISNDSKLVFSISQPLADDDSDRPEIQLFESQRMQVENQINLLEKSRHPKIFGFGQAGYGKPGLNMLSDQFDSYFLLGAGISWSAPDWSKTKRQKQILKLQQEIINTQEGTFIQNIDLLLARQQEEIIKLEKILETDKIMVDLRGEVTKAASSRLENETITTSEYIREIQSETVAKLHYELHKIQLSEAREKYNLIKGKK